MSTIFTNAAASKWQKLNSNSKLRPCTQNEMLKIIETKNIDPN